jgi:hypothetical protein
MKKNSELSLDPELVREAQSIVALAFRNGPIENVHAGKECLVCAGKAEYSHITEAEMKRINKRAVDKLYALLRVKRYSSDVYPDVLNAGIQYAHGWDLPEKNREELEGLIASRTSPIRTQWQSKLRNGNERRERRRLKALEKRRNERGWPGRIIALERVLRTAVPTPLSRKWYSHP